MKKGYRAAMAVEGGEGGGVLDCAAGDGAAAGRGAGAPAVSCVVSFFHLSSAHSRSVSSGPPFLL